MGIVAGRSLLYPADGGVAAAVDTTVSLLCEGGSMDSQLHLAAGSAAGGPYRLAITPEQAGWLICDDPAHAWVRGRWASQPADPRLPVGGVQA